MTLGEYRSKATETPFESESMAVYEDFFWENITRNKPYALDDSKSGFGAGTKIWNLSKFTNAESNVHTTPSLFKVRVICCNSDKGF